ncbi:MAG: hypothetical protein Q9192_008794, partial [Flavoplaca navasiana]
GQDGGDGEDEDRESHTVSDEKSASDCRDPENESFKSGSLERCECGYISHESDWDNSSDAESEYDFLGQRLDYHGLSRSYRHYVTCRANKEPFPLEKLPPEVRRVIFRLTMPDYRFEPLHVSEYDWNDKYDGRISGFDDCMEEQWEPQAIPHSLFVVQGFMANEALAVFHKDVYFRMDISPFGIRTRDHLTHHLKNFKNHEELAKWTEFQTRRKYHLNIKSNTGRWTGGGDAYEDAYSYKLGSCRIKEWVRLISDELFAKDIIQTLVITAPCRCALKAARVLPENETSIFDLFTPLKRTRVPNPVILSLHDDLGMTGIENPCSEPACLQLKHDIQAQLGRLDGEPLNEREAIWKDCKLRYHNDAKLEKKAPSNKDSLYDDLYGDIVSVWGALSGIYSRETTFEEAVQYFHKRLDEREQAREMMRRIEREKRLKKEHKEELQQEKSQ